MVAAFVYSSAGPAPLPDQPGHRGAAYVVA